MADIQASTVSSESTLLTFANETFDHWAKNRKTLLEPKWNRNREAYRGIMTGAWKTSGDDSQTHVGVTRQKVVAGFALVMDQEMQGGDVPFMLVPSPVQNVEFEEMPPEVQEAIKDAIEDQTDLMKQQAQDCHADRALSKNVMSAAIYGETYAKYFVHDVVVPGWRPVQPEGFDFSRVPQGEATVWEPFSTSHKSPGWDYVSVWKIYRDLETEHIRLGGGVIQRDMICPYDLRSKMGAQFWIKTAIEAVISGAKQTGSAQSLEGKDSLIPGLREIVERTKNIDFRESYLRCPAKDVLAYERDRLAEARAVDPTAVIDGIPEPEPVEPGAQEPGDGETIDVAVGVANSQIVFYRRMDHSEWPFYRIVWQDDLDEVGGSGIADNVENSQKLLNGSVRAFEHAKKMSSSPLMGVKERMLVDGKAPPVVAAGMVVRLNDACRDIREALSVWTVPDVAASLLTLIDLGFRICEEDSMIPRTAQGLSQSEKMTAYQIATLVERAGKYIGAVIRNIDALIEDVFTDFYNYNMADPDQKRGKGNFTVKALGFTSYQDRVVRMQNLMQFLTLLIQNPILAADYKVGGIAEEFGKALNIRTEQFKKTPEEKAAEAEQAGGMTPEVALSLQMVQANVEKVRAETQAILAKIQQEQQRIEVAQAETMAKLQNQMAPPPPPPPAGVPG